MRAFVDLPSICFVLQCALHSFRNNLLSNKMFARWYHPRTRFLANNKLLTFIFIYCVSRPLFLHTLMHDWCNKYHHFKWKFVAVIIDISIHKYKCYFSHANRLIFIRITTKEPSCSCCAIKSDWSWLKLC
jgi:hypothetical protein